MRWRHGDSRVGRHYDKCASSTLSVHFDIRVTLSEMHVFPQIFRTWKTFIIILLLSLNYTP